MTRPIARDAIYRRRVFDAEVIELRVRWYISYWLSCRDLGEYDLSGLQAGTANSRRSIASCGWWL